MRVVRRGYEPPGVGNAFIVGLARAWTVHSGTSTTCQGMTGEVRRRKGQRGSGGRGWPEEFAMKVDIVPVVPLMRVDETTGIAITLRIYR